MLEQPLHHQQRPEAGRLMQQRQAVRPAHLRQFGMLIEHGDHRLFAAGLIGLIELARGLGRPFGSARATLSASRVEHVDNLVVAAVAGEDIRAGRIAFRPDAAVGVGSEFEQQRRHAEIAPQDGHVQRAHFAAGQIDNLRTAREQLARSLESAALGGLVQLGRRDAVDGGLQFRPALEAIGPRQHELRVMQRERLARGGAVIGRRLRRRLPEPTPGRRPAVPWPVVSVDRGRGSRAWRESAACWLI